MSWHKSLRLSSDSGRLWELPKVFTYHLAPLLWTKIFKPNPLQPDNFAILFIRFFLFSRWQWRSLFMQWCCFLHLYVYNSIVVFHINLHENPNNKLLPQIDLLCYKYNDRSVSHLFSNVCSVLSVIMLRNLFRWFWLNENRLKWNRLKWNRLNENRLNANCLKWKKIQVKCIRNSFFNRKVK